MITRVTAHWSGRVISAPMSDPVCPHCGTVVIGSYCGACDKLI